MTDVINRRIARFVELVESAPAGLTSFEIAAMIGITKARVRKYTPLVSQHGLAELVRFNADEGRSAEYRWMTPERAAEHRAVAAEKERKKRLAAARVRWNARAKSKVAAGVTASPAEIAAESWANKPFKHILVAASSRPMPCVPMQPMSVFSVGAE
jgi:hypothetical protein